MDHVYLALPFLQFVVSLFLAGVVISSDARVRTNRLFVLFLFALAAWGIAIFLMRDAFPAHDLAYSREKIVLAAIPFSSIFFCHFVLNLTRAPGRLVLLSTFYAAGVLSAALSLAGQTATGMTEKFYGFAPELGWAFPVVLLAAYPPVAIAILELTRALKKTGSAVERGRLWTLRLGALVTVLGATSDFIPSLGVNIYPMGVLGNIVFAAITTFAVTRYRLMNLRRVARQGLAHTLVSSFVFAFYGVVLLGVAYYGSELSGSARAFVLAAAVLLVGVFVQPALARFQSAVDRLFFRERLDRVRALGKLNDLAKDISDISAVSRNLVLTVSKAVQAEWAALALPDQAHRKLYLAADTRKDAPPFELPVDGAVLTWLTGHGGLLRASDMRVDAHLQAASGVERAAIERFGPELVLPMFSKGTLTGLIMAGPRLVGSGYNSEEVEFLRTAAGQAAVAVENARLFAASQHEARERLALAELAHVVTSTLDLATVFRRCSEQAILLLPCDRLTISTVDTERNFIRYETVTGRPVTGRGPGDVEPVWGSYLDPVVSRREAAVFGAPGGAAVDPASRAAGFQSALAVPLVSNNRSIGAVTLESDAPQAFTAQSVSLAERVAAQVANAVANAQLYQQALQLAEERELRARAEAEKRELQRINEVKSAFLSTVSHELKTPLTSILAFTDILLRNRKGSMGDRDIKHLDVIKRNGKRLGLLINDLLDVSRLDNGTLRVQRQHFDFRELLSELQESFGPILESKRQTLSASVPDSPLGVYADRDRMAQVISNLLSNASKYSPPETAIELEAKGDGGRVNVRVKDNGIGISPADQKKLFTAFFRAENDATRSVPGTGLGLVIAKGIVEIHGGQMALESTQGKGTTVSFDITAGLELPEAAAAAGAA